MIDWTWQVEAVLSIAASIGIGLLGRRAIARLDARRRGQR